MRHAVLVCLLLVGCSRGPDLASELKASQSRLNTTLEIQEDTTQLAIDCTRQTPEVWKAEHCAERLDALQKRVHDAMIENEKVVRGQ